ncbi:glycosyltransferase [Yeosuana marina]|uniref:glycosyltransferase n=1 Tax=Yeosuana marina TaxID=1565536 RepID=UPI0030EF7808
MDRKIILLTAGNINDKRKSTRYALESLKNVKDLKPFILIVGEFNNSKISEFQDFDYLVTVYILNDNLKSEFFTVSDLFLYCSLADNLPLVVLETMASGVPVVGFDTGGIPEMVKQDETGYLVNQKNTDALAKAIRHAFSENHYQTWGVAARNRAEEKFSNELFFQKHLDLYYKQIKSFKN